MKMEVLDWDCRSPGLKSGVNAWVSPTDFISEIVENHLSYSSFNS